MAAQIKSEMIFVTPEIAKQYLSLNEDNRRVRNTWVDYLAHSIKSGEWQSTHQGIGFSKSGRLLDGQHRLMAIVKANIPVYIMVTYGLDENVFSAIDNGIKRTDEDLTHIPKRVIEVIKFFLMLTLFEGTEKPSKGWKNTPQQIFSKPVSTTTASVFSGYLLWSRMCRMGGE
jgi:hypothetical protein